MKTEYDFGWDYAEWMKKEQGITGEVNLYEMRNDISSIPARDCTSMRNEGIMEVISYLYWQGYNDYMSQIQCGNKYF